MHSAANTFFSGYKPNSNKINTALLWDYDISCFDWQKSKAIVVQRIIECGDFSDFMLALIFMVVFLVSEKLSKAFHIYRI